MDELCERLARLEPLAVRPLGDFDRDPYLRDIAERNLEIAAQCCIDLAHRVISLERAQRPRDYFEAILRLGELGVLDAEFARNFAPVAGFRNVLAHEYLEVDWKRVHERMQDLGDFRRFAEAIRLWVRKRPGRPEVA